MVQWVLDALSQSSAVERVIVVGLPPETDLDCAHELILLPDLGDVLNIRAAANEIAAWTHRPPTPFWLLATYPLMRGEMVDWLLEQAAILDQDVYYTRHRTERPWKRFSPDPSAPTCA
jgi:hypothetical protein